MPIQCIARFALLLTFPMTLPILGEGQRSLSCSSCSTPCRFTPLGIPYKCSNPLFHNLTIHHSSFQPITKGKRVKLKCSSFPPMHWKRLAKHPQHILYFNKKRNREQAIRFSSTATMDPRQKNRAADPRAYLVMICIQLRKPSLFAFGKSETCSFLTCMSLGNARFLPPVPLCII